MSDISPLSRSPGHGTGLQLQPLSPRTRFLPTIHVLPPHSDCAQQRSVAEGSGGLLALISTKNYCQQKIMCREIDRLVPAQCSHKPSALSTFHHFPLLILCKVLALFVAREHGDLVSLYQGFVHQNIFRSLCLKHTEVKQGTLVVWTKDSTLFAPIITYGPLAPAVPRSPVVCREARSRRECEKTA
jgi:hypothetical protein